MPRAGDAIDDRALAVSVTEGGIYRDPLLEGGVAWLVNQGHGEKINCELVDDGSGINKLVATKNTVHAWSCFGTTQRSPTTPTTPC